jgi:hypothetical protein
MNFITNLIKKFSKPEIKIGDRFVDKIWGDTVIEIVAISLNKKELRYKFLKTNGNSTPFSTICSIAKWFVLEKYTKINYE